MTVAIDVADDAVLIQGGLLGLAARRDASSHWRLALTDAAGAIIVEAAEDDDGPAFQDCHVRRTPDGGEILLVGHRVGRHCSAAALLRPSSVVLDFADRLARPAGAARLSWRVNPNWSLDPVGRLLTAAPWRLRWSCSPEAAAAVSIGRLRLSFSLEPTTSLRYSFEATLERAD